MKVYISALAICCIFLAGCSQSANQRNMTPTLELATSTVVQPTITPTSPPAQEETATITTETEEPQPALPDQEALKEEWRSAINNAIILFSTCEWMFETHFDFQQGNIDIEEAKSDLSLEADFISWTRWDSPAAYQNETAAEFMWRLEMEMGGLIELIDTTDDDMIGSAEVLDTLLLTTCSSLFDLLTDIIDTAMEAGLTQESINEIDITYTEMFNDFYEMIFGEI